jgi:hypothetical protein
MVDVCSVIDQVRRLIFPRSAQWRGVMSMSVVVALFFVCLPRLLQTLYWAIYSGIRRRKLTTQDGLNSLWCVSQTSNLGITIFRTVCLTSHEFEKNNRITQLPRTILCDWPTPWENNTAVLLSTDIVPFRA